MSITGVTGTIVNFTPAAFVQPGNTDTVAGIVFNIGFDGQADARLKYGIHFLGMHNLVTNNGITDPAQLLGQDVTCDINDNLQITAANLI